MLIGTGIREEDRYLARFEGWRATSADPLPRGGFIDQEPTTRGESWQSLDQSQDFISDIPD